MNEQLHPVMARVINTHFATAEAYQQLQAMADAVKARRAALQPTPSPVVVVARTAEQVQAELSRAKLGFDPQYHYSDDHSYWTQQRDKAQDIARLTVELAKVAA